MHFFLCHQLSKNIFKECLDCTTVVQTLRRQHNSQMNMPLGCFIPTVANYTSRKGGRHFVLFFTRQWQETKLWSRTSLHLQKKIFNQMRKSQNNPDQSGFHLHRRCATRSAGGGARGERRETAAFCARGNPTHAWASGRSCLTEMSLNEDLNVTAEWPACSQAWAGAHRALRTHHHRVSSSSGSFCCMHGAALCHNDVRKSDKLLAGGPIDTRCSSRCRDSSSFCITADADD